MNDAVDLVNLVVANEFRIAGDGTGIFERDDAALAVRARQQRLTDDSFEHQRQLQ